MTENLLTMTLSPTDRAELARLEAEYFAGIEAAAEACYRARHALWEIYHRQLYLQTHKNWDTYREGVLKKSRQRVQQILQWAEVEVDVTKQLESPAKLTNRQAQALARVPKAQRGQVLEEAREMHGPEPSAGIIALEAELASTPLHNTGDPEDEEAEAEAINKATNESRERAQKSMTRDAVTIMLRNCKKLKALHARLPDVADRLDELLSEYVLTINSTTEII